MYSERIDASAHHYNNSILLLWSPAIATVRTLEHYILLKAKFHYANWFGAGSKLDRAEIWPIV